MLHLFPYFGAGGGFVGLHIVGIAELIDEISAALLRHALGQILVILRMALATSERVSTTSAPMARSIEYLFLAHLVGNHQNQVIPFLRCHQRQPQTGVAGGGLNDSATGLEIAALFRFRDHTHADAILDGAAGIHAFEFEEQPAGPRIHLLELQHGRAADHFQHIGIDFHAASGKSSNGEQALLYGRA